MFVQEKYIYNSQVYNEQWPHANFS